MNSKLIPPIIGVLFVIGWSLNTVKIADCDFEAPYGCELIRGIGFLTPISIITGWIDIKDY